MAARYSIVLLSEAGGLRATWGPAHSNAASAAILEAVPIAAAVDDQATVATTFALSNGVFARLVARGLTGVRLVISDAHSGLKMAIESILQGAVWQRCRVHFVRDALALVPKHAQQMVAATIRTVFVQPDA